MVFQIRSVAENTGNLRPGPIAPIMGCLGFRLSSSANDRYRTGYCSPAEAAPSALIAITLGKNYPTPT
jgi:hypothetical protein